MILTTLALVSAAFASQPSIQQINCSPMANTNDRVVMTLILPTNARQLPVSGTLLLSSGIDENGQQETSGVMKLTLLPASADDVKYSRARYEARNSVANFIVTMNETEIAKSLQYFNMGLSLGKLGEKSRIEQRLGCYATVFKN